MSEVTEILEEIERYVAYWESQPESREKGQEEFAVDLHKKTIALLSTHVVIDKETADYASRVIEAYTQDQIFTADVAGTISGFKAEFKSELSRQQEQKK